MHRLRAIALAAVVLTAATSTLNAQGYNFPPVVNGAGSTSSFAPTNVKVAGLHLGVANRVTVDGVEAVIVRPTVRFLIMRPQPGAPGFPTVSVRTPFGTDTTTMEMTPSLSVGPRRGNVMDLTLNNGDTGMYVLNYSFGLLANPIVTPGVFHELGLDLTTAASGVLDAGMLGTADPLVLQRLRAPIERGLVGQSFYVQGLTADSAGNMSYTNVVQVPALR